MADVLTEGGRSNDFRVIDPELYLTATEIDTTERVVLGDGEWRDVLVVELLLVVRADYTDRKTAQAAVRRLLLDGIPVMGVIFNYWDPTHSDVYGYARYHQDLV